MKNVSHKKGRLSGAFQIHENPLYITLIQRRIDMNLDKGYAKIKLHINLRQGSLKYMNSKLDLFDNVEPVEFLLFKLN